MKYRFPTSAGLVSSLLIGSLLAPSTAMADGEAGEHVAEFHKHLDDYEADVRKLEDTLDTLVKRYAQERRAGNDAMTAVVEAWESVNYHAAVEEIARPLYQPIWQAINGLREAVGGDESPEVVRQRAGQVSAALREGLGGLKLQARMAKSDGPGKAAAEPQVHGPAATLARIRAALDHAVEAYADGQGEDAKQSIQDAYFNHFEGLEGELIEQDAELVARLEEAFNAELPGLMNQGAAVTKVRAKVADMKKTLERSQELLEQADKDDSGVF